MKVRKDQIWSYNGTGVLYRITGLPTLRNALFDLDGTGDKWIPAVAYRSLSPEDPAGKGDNREFIRNRQNFLENFTHQTEDPLLPIPLKSRLKMLLYKTGLLR
jgi:hypothetical protein